MKSKAKFTDVLILLLAIAPASLFVYYVLREITYNPYNEVSYEVNETTCIRNSTANKCTITLSVHNGSTRRITPDFTGTNGPGFAESGVWGVYMVDSKNLKTQEYVETEAYGGSIPPVQTVTAPIHVELNTDAEPRKLVIFGKAIVLKPLYRK
ncbi:MAG TPA: hypothetical protein PLU21_03835 [Candidatus Saccharibacteria bacterium]|nr:hypothetical protein [Candidatus Saccharibacteria bacterium]